MGANSGIAWTDHTFNPWFGCTKVSPECTHCYAEIWNARFKKAPGWGPRADRSKSAASTWKLPLRWNRASNGGPVRVFCASLSDVFDDHPSIAQAWRDELLDLIGRTPNLEWLLLTKRPENIPAALTPKAFPNVRIGVTAGLQAWANECIPELLARWHGPNFVSYEPALGPVDFRLAEWPLHWIIAGAESGMRTEARAADLSWFRDVRDQCQAVGWRFL
jgi:protein gp37